MEDSHTLNSPALDSHSTALNSRALETLNAFTNAFATPISFDCTIERANTNSIKWDVGESELPMWVADTDFAVPPPVHQAILRRAAHPLYGYSQIPFELFEAYSSWWQRRHHLAEDLCRPSDMVFTTGVVPAISSIVRSVTKLGQGVIVQPPVYYVFYNSIRNNQRKVVENPLIHRDGQWLMDFDLLEEQAADPNNTLLILCNPQNPTGTIWRQSDLAKVAEICAKNNVAVIADEIHCDLTRPSLDYVPFRSVSEQAVDISITCWSPSKTFNIAGLNSAVMLISHPKLRKVAEKGVNTDEVAEPGAFALDPVIAAYTSCDQWVDDLREYVFANKTYVTERVLSELKDLGVTTEVGEATYLLWIDCAALGVSAQELGALLREETGLFLTSGHTYGAGGEYSLRMNLATSRQRVVDGAERLIRGLRKIGDRSL